MDTNDAGLVYAVCVRDIDYLQSIGSVTLNGKSNT